MWSVGYNISCFDVIESAKCIFELGQQQIDRLLGIDQMHIWRYIHFSVILLLAAVLEEPIFA